LFAGPGAGKSTICAHVFAELKWLGVNCEMALEHAKDLVWQKSFEVLENQLYVFGKQQHRLFRLNGKVDVVITDSPLINSVIYDCRRLSDKTAGFSRLLQAMVLGEHEVYDNLNFFIERHKRYKPEGRRQTEDQAKELDSQILATLVEHAVPHASIPGTVDGVKMIITALMTHRPDLAPTQ